MNGDGVYGSRRCAAGGNKRVVSPEEPEECYTSVGLPVRVALVLLMSPKGNAFHHIVSKLGIALGLGSITSHSALLTLICVYLPPDKLRTEYQNHTPSV